MYISETNALSLFLNVATHFSGINILAVSIVISIWIHLLLFTDNKTMGEMCTYSPYFKVLPTQNLINRYFTRFKLPKLWELDPAKHCPAIPANPTCSIPDNQKLSILNAGGLSRKCRASVLRMSTSCKPLKL